jgi:hypothetical protein
MDATQQPNDNWLLSPPTPPAAESADGSVEPEAEPGSDVITSGQSSQRRSLLTGSALAAAGLLAGAVGTFALGHHGSGTTTFQNAGSTTAQGGLPPGGLQGGTSTQGRFGGPGGGMDGEQRLTGTITAVGSSSVTVKTASATTTYAVTSTTEIVRDGAAATLSQLKAGDPVLLHVYPLNGTTVVERLFAGTLSQGSFPGGPGAPGGFAPGGPGTSQQTQPSGVING